MTIFDKIKKFLFGPVCCVSWCTNKPTVWMRISSGPHYEMLPYCDSHAKIADEMFRNGEIKVKMPYHYDPL